MKLEDLKKLMETPVEKPQLQFVRDMFIFSTFTGLAYADLKRLTTHETMTVRGGFIYAGKRQIRLLLSACWIYLCGLLRNTVANGRGTRCSIFMPGDILSC